jgi:sugar lactone lactonase YvrE
MPYPPGIVDFRVRESRLVMAPDPLLPELWISDELDAGTGTVYVASPAVWQSGGTVDRVLVLDIPLEQDAPGQNWAFDESTGRAWTASWRAGHESLYAFTSAGADGTFAAPDITIETPNESKHSLLFRDGNLWGIDRATANSRLFRYTAAQIAQDSPTELVADLTVIIICGAQAEATTDNWIWDDQDYIWTGNFNFSGVDHGRQLLGISPAQYATDGTITPAVICEGTHFDGNPGGIVADPNGTHCWVAFWDSGEVKRFSFADLRAGGNTAPDIVFTSPAFMNPWGLAMGPDGVLWVAAYNECKAVGFLPATIAASGDYEPDRVIDVPGASSVYNITFRPRN